MTISCLDFIMQPRKRDIVTMLSLQVLMAVLFGIFVRYGKSGDSTVYPMFQDVHVMIFAGFGFLMTFLRRYGYSAVGFNFLLASLMIQWAILCHGLSEILEDGRITLNVKSLLKADVAAAAVLISMGAVLGRTSYMQLLVMGFIEIALFSLNAYLGSDVFWVADAGGSIFVHTMGAYFGLAVSFVIRRKKSESQQPESALEGSSYTSDLFAMIGSIFLWMFWPSFNAGELEGDGRERAIINTYLALASCCVTSFAVSAMLTPGHKFDMVHVQNSTLAGGVAIGSAANMMIQPYGAVIVGIAAGALSVFGYAVLMPRIDKHLRIHDTCGVHNLHGMPGIMAGLVSVLMAGIATEDIYQNELFTVFPAMAPTSATVIEGIEFDPGLDRSASMQAAYQAIGLVVTLGIAIVGGITTGFIVRSPLTTKPDKEEMYSDDTSWHVPQ